MLLQGADLLVANDFLLLIADDFQTRAFSIFNAYGALHVLIFVYISCFSNR